MNMDKSGFNADVPGMQVLYADRAETGRITYIRDVVYDEKSGMPLHMQMLYPKVPTALLDTISGKEPANPFQTSPNLPCVVYIQGSAWGKQDCYKNLPLLIDIARKGFVVASVEYRPAQVEPFPGFVLDVKSAIRFLKANAALYGIDSKRVAVWGCSSGGHTALMVGATNGMKEFDQGIYPEQDSSVCACVSYYGVSEFRPFLEGGAFARPHLFDLILGDRMPHDESGADALSPLRYLEKCENLPAFQLIHGDRDPVVPFEQSVLMYEGLKKVNAQAEFFKVTGAGHGDFFWTPEVIEVTGRFLKAYL